MKEVDLEDLITKMFPWSMFGSTEIPTAIKAYCQGFKDAYANSCDNAIIKIVQGETARERLIALYLKGDNHASDKKGP